jgi:hypothetical protein
MVAIQTHADSHRLRYVGLTVRRKLQKADKPNVPKGRGEGHMPRNDRVLVRQRRPLRVPGDMRTAFALRAEVTSTQAW